MATSKKSAAKKTAAKKTAAKKTATTKAAKEASGKAPSAVEVKQVTADDLFDPSQPEEAYASKEELKGRGALRRLARTTIEGRPMPGTPDDTRARVDRGIVRPRDV